MRVVLLLLSLCCCLLGFYFIWQLWLVGPDGDWYGVASMCAGVLWAGNLLVRHAERMGRQ